MTILLIGKAEGLSDEVKCKNKSHVKMLLACTMINQSFSWTTLSYNADKVTLLVPP